MSDKKNEILKVALRLFNERGLDQVTTRDVARDVKISLGNLTYYFPVKNDIVHALVQEMTNAVDSALASKEGNQSSSILIIYYHQVKIIFESHLKYRFLFSRWGETVSAMPKIQQFTQDFLQHRFNSWEELHKQLVKDKLAKRSLEEDTHAHSYVINILALFWHQEFLIYFPKLNDKQKVEKALAIFFQSYKPYLTEKGLKELMPLLKKLEHYSS
jgi:AcrR family transcriptional regulator